MALKASLGAQPRFTGCADACSICHCRWLYYIASAGPIVVVVLFVRVGLVGLVGIALLGDAKM
eukprot:9422305-Pyramimonas_sp.AAC.1